MHPGRDSKWSRASPILNLVQICLKPKIPMTGWGGGGGGRSTSQLLMLSPNLLKTQNPYICLGGGGGRVFQLLMQSPKLPRTQIPYVCLRRLGGGVKLCWKYSKYFDKHYAVPRCSCRIQNGPHALCVRGTIKSSDVCRIETDVSWTINKGHQMLQNTEWIDRNYLYRLTWRVLFQNVFEII